MTCCFGFFLDSAERKLLHDVKLKPFNGSITLHFKEGVIKTISREYFDTNPSWNKTVKENEALKVD